MTAINCDELEHKITKKAEEYRRIFDIEPNYVLLTYDEYDVIRKYSGALQHAISPIDTTKLMDMNVLLSEHAHPRVFQAQEP